MDGEVSSVRIIVYTCENNKMFDARVKTQASKRTDVVPYIFVYAYINIADLQLEQRLNNNNENLDSKPEHLFYFVRFFLIGIIYIADSSQGNTNTKLTHLPTILFFQLKHICSHIVKKIASLSSIVIVIA
jgi:hypothetical protein